MRALELITGFGTAMRRWWCLLRCSDTETRLDPNTHTYRCQRCGADWGELP